MVHQSTAMRWLGFASLIALIVPVHSANDWSVPCLTGTCEYDLPSSSGASGNLQIWGSNNTISDITSAAGWEILGCSSDELSQDIRLVCMNNSTTCDHLYEGDGAEGKLVRLPENCGKSAFARVAKAWIPEDQSMPSNVAARMVRRDGNVPQVKALALDTKFASVNSSEPVGFRLVGVNVPGVDMSAAASQLHRRGLFDIVGDAIDSVSDSTSFNVTNSTKPAPFDIDQKFNLFNQSISCGPVSAALNIDVDAKAHGTVAVGVVATGSIFPPDISQFSLTSDFTAQLSGTVDLQGDLSGKLETPTIPVVPPLPIPLAGLAFPGIFAIGTTFQVDAKATAELDIGVDMTVGLNYEIKNGHLVFPPSDDSKDDKKSSNDFEIQDTPLQLSLSPSVQANGSVSAHLIPTLKFGISALDDLVDASIFLDLDTSATLALSLEAADQGNVTVGNGKRSLVSLLNRASSPTIVKPTSVPRAIAAAKAAREAEELRTEQQDSNDKDNSTVVNDGSKSDNKTMMDNSSDSNSTNSNSGSNDNSNSTNTNSDDNFSFGGCFQVLAGLDVNAGAEGKLFGIFDASTQVSLFSKEFELFKKCFGDQASNKERRSLIRRSQFERHLSRRADDDDKAVAALNCLAETVGAPVSIINDPIKSKDIPEADSTSKSSKSKSSSKA